MMTTHLEEYESQHNLLKVRFLSLLLPYLLVLIVSTRIGGSDQRASKDVCNINKSS
jgi:hypothetical protein